MAVAGVALAGVPGGGLVTDFLSGFGEARGHDGP